MLKLIVMLPFLWVSEKGPLPQGATVWLSQNIRWQHAPKEYNAELQYGSGTIVYFREDGKFGRLKCVLNRVGQRLNVSLGDGFSVEQGTWTAAGNRLNIRHRVVAESLPPIGAVYPGPESVGVARVAGTAERPTIQFAGQRFLLVKGVEDLSPPRLEFLFFRSLLKQ
jgi:hypothetical protein